MEQDQASIASAIDTPLPCMPIRAGLHELAEARYGDHTAVTGFALAASLDAKLAERGENARPTEPAVLWISGPHVSREHGDIFEAGVRGLGFRPQAIIRVQPRKAIDALWCIEEGAKSGALSRVFAEIEALDFTASRRLSLITARTGVSIVCLMPWHRQGASAATTRWRISAQPSATNPFDQQSPGALRWRAMLERAREAPNLIGRSFDLEFDHAALRLHLVSGLAANPAGALAAPTTKPRSRPADTSPASITRLGAGPRGQFSRRFG
jgi:protein ImuA